MVRNSRTVNESRGARGKCLQLPSYMEGGRPGVLTHGPFQKAFVFRPNLPWEGRGVSTSVLVWWWQYPRGRRVNKRRLCLDSVDGMEMVKKERLFQALSWARLLSNSDRPAESACCFRLPPPASAGKGNPPEHRRGLDLNLTVWASWTQAGNTQSRAQSTEPPDLLAVLPWMAH